jgi:hypothetical protein
VKRSNLAWAILVATLILPAAVLAQTGQAPGRTQGVMTGTVADASGGGIAGTKVKIFEEGTILAEATTEADGGYRLEFEFLPDIDWTIVVWYVPPEGELIPEIVILRESLKSREFAPALQPKAQRGIVSVEYSPETKTKAIGVS